MLLFLKNRAILLLKGIGIFSAVCIIYYVIYRTMGLGIVCPLNKLTGLLCPVCGASRMLVSLLHFDFRSALYFNGAFLLLLPLWLITAIFYFYGYVKSGNTKAMTWHKIVIYSSIAVLVGFGILRNVTSLGLLPAHSIFTKFF